MHWFLSFRERLGEVHLSLSPCSLARRAVSEIKRGEVGEVR